jgi:hypothetical protein
MIAQLLRTIPAATVLAAAAFSMPAQAGVSWSLGISAPIAPGVAIGTVVGGGRAHFGAMIAPAPVVYAPPPVYYSPPPVVYSPPVYLAPPVYAPTRVVYGPPVYVAPRRHYYRPAPVMYRPAPVVMRPVHRGPYGPVAIAR